MNARVAVVKSFSESEDEILSSILALHNSGNPFDLDPCFSTGSFYKSGAVPVPALRFDIAPAVRGVAKASVVSIPIAEESISSVVCDLPFMFNPHGRAKSNAASKRFTMFASFDDFAATHQRALLEFRRILRPGGIVALKCQDYTDNRTTMSHCLIYQWAVERGFYAKDLFVRIRHCGPAFNPSLVQRHARKFHSYWWVFEKIGLHQ